MNIFSPSYASLMRSVVSTGFGQQPEFNLHSEDFPALPGASGQNGQNGRSLASQAFSLDQLSSSLQQTPLQAANPEMDTMINGMTENGKQPGIRIESNGVVSNIPPGMLTDQYGIAGMLAFLRTIENEPSILGMALGYDLTHLGLNLNSSERNMYLTFGGPWAEAPTRVQDCDVKVPDEYLTNAIIREKLPQIKMNKFSEDSLFYMFYNFPGQVYQLASALELYQRDWRYHKKDQVWLTRMNIPGAVKEQTSNYEKGTYSIFDPMQWRKIPKEMTLDYQMLEEKPTQGAGNPSIFGTAVTGSAAATNASLSSATSRLPQLPPK